MIIGRDVYVGPGAAIRADWGGIVIEDGCNVQESCTVHMFPGVTVVLEARPPGSDAEVVRNLLRKDLHQTLQRHEGGAKIFTAMGDVGPAMGMIGTLVGLVVMLGNMDDPKSIGPAMAIALLTTLYGAMFANMFALPIADKLSLRREEEGRVKSMIIDALMAIQSGQNPRVIDSMLKMYLPESKRAEEA